jgi:hypothetical protein
MVVRKGGRSRCDWRVHVFSGEWLSLVLKVPNPYYQTCEECWWTLVLMLWFLV